MTQFATLDCVVAGASPAEKLARNLVKALQPSRTFLLEAGFEPCNRVVARLTVNHLVHARVENCRKSNTPHGRMPTFAAFKSSHCWAARNRSKPGTLAFRLISFHLASKPGAWSLSIRLKRYSTKRATR